MAKKYLAGLLTGVGVVYIGDKIFKKDASVESAVAAPSLATRAKVLSDVPVLLHGVEDPNGRWLVVGKKGITEARLREVCGLFKTCGKVGHPDRGVPFFEVHASETELEKVLALAPGEFDFVEADRVVTLDPEEDEEAMASASRSWGLDRVNAPDRFATGAGAHIYVVDTGIRVSHSDFGSRAIPAIDVFLGGGVTECNGDPNCAADRQGHGTHCAGTAAGTEFGVANGALVYAVKGLSDQGSGSSAGLVSCMDWVANSGLRPAVASLSLGSAGVSSMWSTTIDRVTEAGVTVVVTAGNANSDACTRSPAHVRSAITTGSTTSTDERSGFSGWGSCVDMFAPGSRITSASQNSDTGSSIKSGTSMACPHVSGASALVLSQNPNMKPADVYAEIVSRAERGALGNMKPNDKNYFLWVGSDAAPVPVPTPAPPPEPVRVCPDFAANPRPDGDGDCLCANRDVCSRDGQNRNCPTSGSIGGYGGRYFYFTCQDCRCFESLGSSAMVMA